MKNMKEILCILLCCVFLSMMSGSVAIVLAGNFEEHAFDFKESAFEEKLYSRTTIEDDFDGSSVLIVMDKRTGGINKTPENSFFNNFEKDSVTDLTLIEGDIEKKQYLNKEEFLTQGDGVVC